MQKEPYRGFFFYLKNVPKKYRKTNDDKIKIYEKYRGLKIEQTK